MSDKIGKALHKAQRLVAQQQTDALNREAAMTPQQEQPPRIEHCPVCGHAVRVVGTSEGTNHYEPVESTPSPDALREALEDYGSHPLADVVIEMDQFVKMTPANNPAPGWVSMIQEWSGRLRTALAATPSPSSGLDVELVAAALDVLADDGLEYDLMAPEEREERRDTAERLTAEYARLTEQKP